MRHLAESHTVKKETLAEPQMEVSAFIELALLRKKKFGMRHLVESHTVKRETLSRTSDKSLCFYIYIDYTSIIKCLSFSQVCTLCESSNIILEYYFILFTSEMEIYSVFNL
jgi:hypothetical protein